MIETHRSKNVVIFVQTILSFVLSRIIKECNQKIQITGLRKKIIKELKDLVYTQTEKHKSYNTRRRVNHLGLKKLVRDKILQTKTLKRSSS